MLAFLVGLICGFVGTTIAGSVTDRGSVAHLLTGILFSMILLALVTVIVYSLGGSY